MKSLNFGEGNKPSWDYLLDDFRKSMEHVLDARMYGANKYDRFNWLCSCNTEDHDEFLAKNRRSIFRHLLDMAKEEIDVESGLPHAAMVGMRALIHLEYISRERASRSEDKDLEKEAEGDGGEAAPIEMRSYISQGSSDGS